MVTSGEEIASEAGEEGAHSWVDGDSAPDRFDEAYFVLCVDYETQLADLLPILSGSLPAPAVLFGAMEAIPGWGRPDLNPDYHN